MRKGTKIGIFMIALSVILAAWVFGTLRSVDDEGDKTSVKKKDSAEESVRIGDFVLKGQTLIAYNGKEKSIVLPDGVSAIAEGAFSGKEIAEIAGDDDVKSIASEAFMDSKLSTYSLPPKLSNLSQDAFRGSKELTSFSGGSSSYSVQGGCVYKDNGKTLYIVPEGKQGSVEIPNGASSIAPGAFEGADGVSVLYIPKSVKKISGLAKTKVELVYGYSDSRAQKAAEKNGIRFVAIGGEDATVALEQREAAPSVNVAAATYYGADDQDEEYTDETRAFQDQEYNVPDDVSTAEGVPQAPQAVYPPAAAQSAAPVNGAGTAAQGTQQASHSLDSTPKTADGDIDPRFVLCLAIFLGGMAVLFFSRLKRYEYVATRHALRDDELD